MESIAETLGLTLGLVRLLLLFDGRSRLDGFRDGCVGGGLPFGATLATGSGVDHGFRFFVGGRGRRHRYDGIQDRVKMS